jgi:hypothetical protein
MANAPAPVTSNERQMAMIRMCVVLLKDEHTGIWRGKNSERRKVIARMSATPWFVVPVKRRIEAISMVNAVIRSLKEGIVAVFFVGRKSIPYAVYPDSIATVIRRSVGAKKLYERSSGKRDNIDVNEKF